MRERFSNQASTRLTKQDRGQIFSSFIVLQRCGDFVSNSAGDSQSGFEALIRLLFVSRKDTKMIKAIRGSTT